MNYGSENHKKAVEEACKKLEEEGFKTIIVNKRIPDIIAYKGEISLVEVIRQGQTKSAEGDYQEAYPNIPLRVLNFRSPAQEHRNYVDYEPQHQWTKTEDTLVATIRKEPHPIKAIKRVADLLGLRFDQVRWRYYSVMKNVSPKVGS